jgi:hypothetical protein
VNQKHAGDHLGGVARRPSQLAKCDLKNTQSQDDFRKVYLEHPKLVDSHKRINCLSADKYELSALARIITL